MSRYPLFDRSRLTPITICDILHRIEVDDFIHPEDAISTYMHPEWKEFTSRLKASAPLILFIGAHVIKCGLSRYIVDLIRRGFITHVATTGATLIHDYELSVKGSTSENVSQSLCDGTFGMSRETSYLNNLINDAAANYLGIGEAVGRNVYCSGFHEISIFAAAHLASIPITVHVSIGSDIVFQHPNCNGASWGAASYTDFLIFAESLNNAEGGAFLNFGSAVTGPEIFLKALSMIHNVGHRLGDDFTTAVFDLISIPSPTGVFRGDWRDGLPNESEHGYYFRPWKTLLVRAVAEGGKSFYFRGNHRETVPALHAALTD